MAHRDRQGRPLVAVTGLGVVTSLGQGREDNWTALTAGRSGIHAIDRFPTEALRTTIAGTVDFVAAEPFCAPMLSERLAMLAAEEAVGQAGAGRNGDFPGALFIAVPPVELEWPQRQALAEASGQNDGVTYRDLLKARRRPAASSPGTISSCSAPWQTGSPTASAPRARRSRCRRRAPPARPRSSSGSRRSGAARPTPRCASAPTARCTPRR